MIEKNRRLQVYVCKTDDKKKIYFDKVTGDFGSVYYSEKKASTVLLVTTVLLSGAFMRQFDYIVLARQYELFGDLLTVILGCLIGAIAGKVQQKRLSGKEIVVKKIKMDQKKLDDFLLLANVELDQNKGAIFLLLFLSFFSIVVFHFTGTLYLLLGGMILMSMGVFYIFVYDLKKRHKMCAELKKMKIK